MNVKSGFWIKLKNDFQNERMEKKEKKYEIKYKQNEKRICVLVIRRTARWIPLAISSK